MTFPRGSLVTFSGLDGSGKTTIITELQHKLASGGHRVVVLTMYDDLMFFAQLRRLRDYARASIGRVRRRDSGPQYVRVDDDGNLTSSSSWMTGVIYKVTRHLLVRQLTQALDLCIGSAVIAWHRRVRHRTVVTDRYFYDSLVDIAGVRKGRWLYGAEDARQLRPARKRYMSAVLRLAPTPDVSVFVDVPPDVAFRRKPEYPLSHFEGRYTVYRWLFTELVDDALFLSNSDEADAVERLGVLAVAASGTGRAG